MPRQVHTTHSRQILCVFLNLDIAQQHVRKGQMNDGLLEMTRKISIKNWQANCTFLVTKQWLIMPNLYWFCTDFVFLFYSAVSQECETHYNMHFLLYRGREQIYYHIDANKKQQYNKHKQSYDCWNDPSLHKFNIWMSPPLKLPRNRHDVWLYSNSINTTHVGMLAIGLEHMYIPTSSYQW